jgi:hypothetical protein
MLFQEVGFDIVSIGGRLGWTVIAGIALLAVLIVYVVMRAASHRRSSRS